ncbi:MAG: hypothetical protein HY581_05205 [Nitrospirae bacterium]|nr:hypothetical protein [Nitrospirota bacterium]
MLKTSPTRPLIIAHRGASGLTPENTTLAVATAIALGADMVEVDVRLSRDGHLIVFHDQTVGRTASFQGRSPHKKIRSVRITDLTLDEIRRLDAGSWRGTAFTGLGVPTLEQILGLCAGRIALNLEMKPDAGPASSAQQTRTTMVAQLSRSLNTYPAPDSVLVSSSDQAALELVRERSPGARLGVLVTARTSVKAGGLSEALRSAGRLEAYSLHLPCALVRQAVVAATHRKGLRLFVYTANGIAAMRRLVSAGVDGIFTDRPERLLSLLRGAREGKS